MNTNLRTKDVSLPDIVGKGYGTFWRSKARYLVCKGGRGSKKSCTAALKLIYNIMKYPGSHALVVRRYDVTHRESTFAQLKWAISRLGVEHLWKTTISPMKLIYAPTGQTIIFRGLDDPQSIASITVNKGHLCYIWVEEAYQVMKEGDFDKLDLSLRGDVPEPLFKQIILTFNPWNEKHWLKARFFDDPDKFTYSMTTTYLQNEFLGADDRELFELMKERAPGRYAVEGLGNWGILEGAIYTNFVSDPTKYLISDLSEYRTDAVLPPGKERQHLLNVLIGVDWGHDKSANTAVAVGITQKYDVIILDEFYTKDDLDPEKLYERHIAFMEKIINQYGPVRVFADHAEGMLVNGLRNTAAGRRLRASVKKCVKHLINDRIALTNTLFAMDRLKINCTCRHIIDAFQSAIWNGKVVKPERLDDGTSNIDSLDAFEYAICTNMKDLELARKFVPNGNGAVNNETAVFKDG